jgi:membrane-associated phospholipid phosphatase
MKAARQIRSSEWMILVYFCYTAFLVALFLRSGKGLLLAAAVGFAIWLISMRRNVLRDWAPLAWSYVAYRQMDWFTPLARDHHLEQTWIVWDRWLLDQHHLRAVIESSGRLLPEYFELCYSLLFVVTPISIAAICYYGRRDLVNRFWLAYLAGTLGSYALFPYFLSEPPRTVFAGADLPQTVTAIRRFNLWMVQNYGIHASVFPSAHVSAALAAAWGLLIILPERKRLGWMMAIYSLFVAVAAVYGRYHYLADVVSGIAVSFLGLAAAWMSARAQNSQTSAEDRFGETTPNSRIREPAHRLNPLTD